jgi:hypothetical protein
MSDFIEAQQLRAEAERMRSEAIADRRAAEEIQANARYMLGQAEHRRREIATVEQSISNRERHLAELGEAQLLAREQAAEAKLPTQKHCWRVTTGTSTPPRSH